MLKFAYVWEGGVKNCQNHAYVIYGCPEASVIHTENQDHDSNELITWALIKMTAVASRRLS